MAICQGSWKQVPAGQEAGPGDLHVRAHPWVPSVKRRSGKPVRPMSQGRFPSPQSVSEVGGAMSRQ